MIAISTGEGKDSLSPIPVAYVYVLLYVCILTEISQNEPHREKTGFCICENKDADELRGNREADQHLCFRYIDSTIHLLSIYEISSLYPSSVTAQPGFCRTRSETPKTGFLTTRLINKHVSNSEVNRHPSFTEVIPRSRPVLSTKLVL